MSAKRDPAVSMLLAVYNGERFLRQALESICTQNFGDFELVVVDDASTDGTAEILRAWADERLTVLTNDRNLGLTRSLNKAAAASRAPLLARHDADDVSYPERLGRQVACLAAHPEVVLVASAYEYIDENGEVLATDVPPLGDAAIRARLAVGNAFCHGTVMMRRAAFQAVGGYCEAFPVTQDYDLWLRLSEQGQLLGLEEPLYRFRFHPHSVSRRKRELQLIYGGLARHLAAGRRETGTEPAIPSDVAAAFPVDPRRLLKHYREAALLYYIVGLFGPAGETLEQTTPLLEAAGDTADASLRWVLDSAHRVATSRGSVEAGRAFIEWAASLLSLTDTSAAIATYYANQAFMARGRRKAWRWAWRAVMADRRWLLNRGLWSITVRSLARPLRSAALGLALATIGGF